MAAVLDFGLEQVGLQAFIAVLDKANERSVALLTRHKFIPDTNYNWVSAAEAGGLLSISGCGKQQLIIFIWLI